jgi:hypothetical protein
MIRSRPRASSVAQRLGVGNAKRLPALERIPVGSERYFRRYTTVVSVSGGSGVGSP